MSNGKLGTLYAKFRGSYWFLVALGTFVALWIGFHIWKAVDPGLGDYNSILSTEASVATTLLIIDLAKNEIMQRKQLKYIEHLMEAMYAMLQDHDKEWGKYFEDRDGP